MQDLSRFDVYFNGMLSTLLNVGTGTYRVEFSFLSLLVEMRVQISKQKTRYIC